MAHLEAYFPMLTAFPWIFCHSCFFLTRFTSSSVGRKLNQEMLAHYAKEAIVKDKFTNSD